jgi:hypothetical protein
VLASPIPTLQSVCMAETPPSPSSWVHLSTQHTPHRLSPAHSLQAATAPTWDKVSSCRVHMKQ